MIDFICGEVAELCPAAAVVDCHGIGFDVRVSLNTYSALQGRQGAGKVCKLYIHEAIREDAHVLYGFATRRERELFRLLIGVAGIGGNTACTILSALSADELTAVVGSEDAARLKAVKGIGLKTAQRIIVELKDKVKGQADATPTDGGATRVRDEAVAALKMLGFAAAPSQKVVADLLKEQPQATVEQVIKLALARL